ncbi:hypothetical protein BIU82_06510 [Arthrobacter sp. SW1]|uniref:universal stress protein n=1 Tax=Arthrobacter sp. SW1 TaxID=1920889 RepID=UPI000877B836|nr:universal stress protein [Arthrobacter sp. SW1]OFI38142.1 hypothetical protein BIU82_06510 [Arthrobacter sp. SW1]
MVSRILVGVNGSRAARAAADWAARRAVDLGGELVLAHAVPGRGMFPGGSDYISARTRGQELLDGETARLQANEPGLRARRLLDDGEPAQVLCRLSGGAELLALGTDRTPDIHGEGFGSVSFQTAIMSRCPVAVVPAATGAADGGIVVGTDGSRDAAIAVARAAAEARRTGTALTVVHAAGDVTEGRTILGSAKAAATAGSPGVPVRELLDLDHDAPEALREAARNAALLVLGCKGRGGLRVLVGSVAKAVLFDIQCPTLITRAAVT